MLNKWVWIFLGLIMAIPGSLFSATTYPSFVDTQNIQLSSGAYWREAPTVNSGVTTYLMISNFDFNLMDATSVTTNLASAATYVDTLFRGAIVPFAVSSTSNIPSSDWIVCDGSSYVIVVGNNDQLANLLGSTWGVAPTGSFMVPNLSSKYLRGLDSGAGIDVSTNRVLGDSQSGSTYWGSNALSSRFAGTYTTNSTGTHQHTIDDYVGGYSGGSNEGIHGDTKPNQYGLQWERVTGISVDSHTHSIYTVSGGDVETRPPTLVMVYCIKK